MALRAKMNCVGVTKTANWDKSKGPFLYKAEMIPVTGGSKENDSFFASTPSGKIELQSIASDYFQPGREYYVDFIAVEEAKASEPAAD